MKPIAYINVEKRRLEFAEPIKWHTPTVANLERIPLYTQRTWVGLTDKEFQEAVDNLEDLEDCWKAIEAKLKEKNSA